MYKCTNCGETANSKCVHQRNVFPTHLAATVLRNRLTEARNEQGKAVTITLYKEETLADFLGDFVKLSPEEQKIICCPSHDWKIQSGTCLFGCCEAA